MKILFCFILSLALAALEGMAISYLIPDPYANVVAFIFGALTGAYGMAIGLKWQFGY